MRTLFSLTLILVATTFATQYVIGTIRSVTYESEKIHRVDSKRKTTYLLHKSEFLEFHLLPGATTLRLMTNAALSSLDAPGHDLANPRTGWKYAIEYELQDRNLKTIRKDIYHFRSPTRQLIDEETGEAMYPLFFGQSSLVSTQTRTMQLALNGSIAEAARIRVRLVSHSPQIKEVVLRLVARLEREGYQDRTMWMKMPKRQREEMTKYCVYDHDMLTTEQRSSLLRWRWEKCNLVEKAEKRHLFSIGDIDDEEVRPEQLPEGLYCDPNLHASIPVPEGDGRLHLECLRIDQLNSEAEDENEEPQLQKVTREYLTIRSFGPRKEPSGSLHEIRGAVENLTVNVCGGLVSIEPSTRVILRANWEPVDSVAKRALKAELIDDHDKGFFAKAKPDSTTETDGFDSSLDVTPARKVLRTYLVGPGPLDYRISHVPGAPTPVKVQLRIPFSEIFQNSIASDSGLTASEDSSPRRKDVERAIDFNWEILDADRKVIAHGNVSRSVPPSQFDFLLMNSNREKLSDPLTLFFEVPEKGSILRLSSDEGLYLGSVQVRPLEMERVIRLPEDQHAFYRRQATNRSWFGLNPIERTTMMRDNRTFVISLRDRPPELSDDSQDPSELVWKRYKPNGLWFGKPLLVPKEESEAEQDTDAPVIGMNYAVEPNRSYRFKTPVVPTSSVGRATSLKISYFTRSQLGNVRVSVDGNVVVNRRVLNSHGYVRIPLDKQVGALKVECEAAADLFVSGVTLSDAPEFYGRIAQRLDKGKLEFAYDRQTTVEEFLTLRIFMNATEEQGERIRVRVNVAPVDSGPTEAVRAAKVIPLEDWTPGMRVFDLRPESRAEAFDLSTGEKVGLGYRCFVRFPEGSETGRYNVSVKLDDDPISEPNACVLVYQMIAPENGRKHSLRIDRPLTHSLRLRDISRKVPSQADGKTHYEDD